MVSAISQLGHALSLQMVAEGIEAPEQVSTLRGLDCQYGQGYYFARPLTADALGRAAAPAGGRARLEPRCPGRAGSSPPEAPACVR